LELLAQLPDVDVDRAVGLPVRLAPDLAVELLASDDPVAPLHKGGQQLELSYSQVQARSVGQHEELARAKLDLRRAERWSERWSLNRCLHGPQGSSIVRDVRYNRVVRL